MKKGSKKKRDAEAIEEDIDHLRNDISRAIVFSVIRTSHIQAANQLVAAPAKEKKEVKFVDCPSPTDKDTEVHDDAEAGTPTCVICTVNVPCCITVPCMHKSLCCECSCKLADNGMKRQGEVKCPLCKVEVEKFAKVFE